MSSFSYLFLLEFMNSHFRFNVLFPFPVHCNIYSHEAIHYKTAFMLNHLVCNVRNLTLVI